MLPKSVFLHNPKIKSNSLSEKREGQKKEKKNKYDGVS